MNNCHEVERVENLMYKGCESHWHCIHCDDYWPFHCYGKKDLEQMECPARIEWPWISVKDRLPKNAGWYFVYAPGYEGGSSTHRENHNGMMFAKWSGKAWSVERCYYNRPDCVKAWMNLPEPPKEEEHADGA